MKKIIKLSKIDNIYLLLDVEGNEIRKIENKTISGKDIYEKIYLEQLETGFNEIDLKTNLEAKEDQIIYNHLNTLFKKIDASISETFKSETKKVNVEKEKVIASS